MNEREKLPKLNIIVTPKGLDKVSILGGVNLTLEAMEFYRTIAPEVLELDEKIRKKHECFEDDSKVGKGK